MQIIIVHPRLGQARTLTVTPRLAAGVAATLAAVVIATAFLLHILASGFHFSWPGSGNQVAAERSEQAKQEAFLRENINLLARRVGEMQARMVELDALGERVAGLAGVSPTFNFKGAAPGRGGLLVSPQDLSAKDVSSELDKLESQLSDRSDYMSVLDAQLTALSVSKSMTPTVVPVTEGYNGSGFGWRIDPFTGARSMHEGIDFVAPTGTPIVAAAGGVVVAAGFHSGYGNMIDIDNGNDVITRYAHTSKILVQPGDLIRRGQRIALVGSTGRSTGSHLHFEVRISGVAVNPNNFLAHGPGGQPVQPAPVLAQVPDHNLD